MESGDSLLTPPLTFGDLREFEVEGTAWMDHEWFTHQLESTQEGWDWFSAQLDNASELMLFQLRVKGGGIDPFSSGTYIAPGGAARHRSGHPAAAKSNRPNRRCPPGYGADPAASAAP